MPTTFPALSVGAGTLAFLFRTPSLDGRWHISQHETSSANGSKPAHSTRVYLRLMACRVHVCAYAVHAVHYPLLLPVHGF